MRPNTIAVAVVLVLFAGMIVVGLLYHNTYVDRLDPMLVCQRNIRGQVVWPESAKFSKMQTIFGNPLKVTGIVDVDDGVHTHIQYSLACTMRKTHDVWTVTDAPVTLVHSVTGPS